MKSKAPEFSPEYLRSILEYSPETGVFTWLEDRYRVKKGDIAGSLNGGKRIDIKIDQRLYRAHRLAWYYMTGEWPEEQIDHKNTDSLDNRFDNLRSVTCAQNSRNRTKQSNNTSGYKGITWNNMAHKWQPKIQKDGVFYYLGTYENLDEAVEVYRKKAIELFGEFARF